MNLISYLQHRTSKFRLFRRRLTFIGIFLLISATPAVVYLMRLAPAIKASDVLLSFNEGSGNSVADTNSTVSSGSISGAGWQPESMCKFGTCLYFDGADWISFGDESTFDFAAATDFTIEFWFRHGPATAAEIILQKYEASGGDGGYRIQIESDGDISFGVDDANGGFADDSISSTAANYDDNQWHFVSAAKDGTTGIYLYIDSVLVASDTAIGSTGTLANDDTFYLGDSNGADGGDEFIGFLDEIKIYTTTARSQTEINADQLGSTPDRGTSASFGPDQSFLSNGLLGYWKLDETSGNASDSSGNGNNLTDTNTVTFTGGKYGNSGDFESGSSEYQYLADNSTLSITGNITLSAWIKPESNTAATQYDIITKWDSGTESYALVQYGDEIRMYIDSASNYQTSDAVNLATGTWYHVAATYNAAAAKVQLFINGAVVASTTTGTIPSSITDEASRFHIGAEDSAGTADSFFDGLIDEARVYNRTLSPDEVRQLADWVPGPIGYWKLDENYGSPAISTDMLAYRINADASLPKYQRHSGNWGSKSDTSDVTDDILWLEIATKPDSTSDEKVLCTNDDNADTSNDINCQVWNGTTWGSVNEHSTGARDNKGFDVAYEQNSGTPMVCYTDENSGDTQVPYCDIWNGTDWSTAADASGVGSTPNNVYLFPDPNSDYIALVTEDTADDINVQIWNGSSWGNLQEVEDNGSTNNNDLSASGAWDSNGDFMVVWYDSNSADADARGDELQARQFDKSGGWGSQIDNFSTGLGTAAALTNLQVAAHPSNGQIIAIMADDDTTDSVEGFFWNGSSWSQTQLEDSLSAAISSSSFFVNVAYEQTGAGDAVVVYGGTPSTLKYRVFDTASSSWGSEQSLPTSSDTGVDWLQLTSDPTNQRIMLVVLGSIAANNDVDTLEWSGSAWETAFTNQETTSNNALWNSSFTYDFRPDDVQDSSTNNNSGRMEVTMTEADRVSGKFGSAVDFDGSDDYVNVGDINDLDGTNHFTFTAWVKFNALSDYATVLGKSAGADDQIVMNTGGAGDGGDNDDPYLVIEDGANGFAYTTTNLISTGIWNHWAMVYDGTGSTNADKLKFYFNGILQTLTFSGTIPTATDSNAAALLMAAYDTTPTGLANAVLDEVKVYNYARTIGQVIEDMNAGHPAPGSPIGSSVAHWKFEGSTTAIVGSPSHPAQDSSQYNNDLSFGAGAAITLSGKFGSAFAGGDNLRASIAGDSDFDFIGSDDFTISLWFKRSAISTDEYIITKADTTPSSAEGWGVWMDASGDIIFGIADSNSASFPIETIGNVGRDFDDSSWHHAVAVKTGTTSMRLYIDGHEIASDTSLSETSTLANTSTLYLGDLQGTDGTDEFLGDIDEVQVFRSALNANQIKVLHNESYSSSFGVLGTDSSGIADDSVARSYCVPGDTSTCNTPIAHYKFDTNDNSDTTPNQRNVNHSDGGGPSLARGSNANANDSADPQFVPGILGSAMEFDGSADYTSAADDDDLDFGDTDDITAEAWFYHAPASADDRVILSKRPSFAANRQGYVLWIDDAINDVRFEINDAVDTFTMDSTTTFTSPGWHHVAVVVDESDATQTKMYIDGVDDNATQTGTLANVGSLANTAVFAVGKISAQDYFDGKIDNVILYRYARTPAQIAWSYNRGIPIGWWKMDETTSDTCPGGSNDSCDSSGKSNDLVWQGGTSSISGKYSSALNLDTAGGNDYAECTDANCGGTSKLDFNANTDFSWGGWVNTQTTGTTQAVIAKKQGTAVNAGYMLHITTSDVPRCTVGDSSANASATGTTDVVDGTWHHVMCIVEGNLIKIYVDGRFEAQTDATSAVDETHDNTDSFRIGLFGNGNNPLTGKVDDIRVYNYAVTDQQILEAMNLGSVNFAPA